jgi:hypothetical protein
MSQVDQHSGDDKPELAATPDRVKFGRDTTTYTNSGHWTSILDGVSLLKPHDDETFICVSEYTIVRW